MTGTGICGAVESPLAEETINPLFKFSLKKHRIEKGSIISPTEAKIIRVLATKISLRCWWSGFNTHIASLERTQWTLSV
jgi:hypothetical protein